MTSAIFFRRKERIMSSKIREALKKANRTLGRWREDLPVSAWEEVDTTILEIQTALAEPPRNCDVGTAEEQYVRFRDMCVNTNCEGLVKHNTLSEYAFAWSQMPYEEEK
jgi:hypothetical protein